MTIKAINVRNQFKGTIEEIIEGAVLSEIDVQTAAGIVTSVAARELAAAIAASDGNTPQVQAAVDHFHVAMGDLQKATIAHVFEMRSVLTPAQAEVFDAAVVDALRADAG